MSNTRVKFYSFLHLHINSAIYKRIIHNCKWILKECRVTIVINEHQMNSCRNPRVIVLKVHTNGIPLLIFKLCAILYLIRMNYFLYQQKYLIYSCRTTCFYLHLFILSVACWVYHHLFHSKCWYVGLCHKWIMPVDFFRRLIWLTDSNYPLSFYHS